MRCSYSVPGQDRLPRLDDRMLSADYGYLACYRQPQVMQVMS